MPLPKSRKKIIQLFTSIKDESIRKIISDVVSLEYEQRSSSAINFPRKKLEDIIDTEARLIEFERSKKGGK
jgi:hypothetical protein